MRDHQDRLAVANEFVTIKACAGVASEPMTDTTYRDVLE